MPEEISSLETEIEQTRQRLAATIDQLVHRTNPKVIASREVSNVKAFFVDAETGEPRTANIVKAVGSVVGVVGFFVLVRVVVK